MRAFVIIPLLALAFAGCVTSDDVVPPADPTPTTPTPVAAGVTAFAANGSVPPPPVVPVPPAYAEIVLTGEHGGEPTIAVTSSGAMFVMALDETMRSKDDGATWEVVYDLTPGGAEPFDLTGDPMIWADPVTDRVYINHMVPAATCSRIVWSDDDGDTWFTRDGACGAPPFDFQKLGSGVPGPDSNPLVLDYASVLYLCYNRNVFIGGPAPIFRATSACVMSYDGGLTWPLDQTVAERTADGCGGVTSFPVVGPDGTAVLPLGNGCSTFHMGVSTDSGMTWRVVKGPGDVGMESPTPAAAFTPDGTLYAMWIGFDHAPYLARTKDLGETWDGPWRVAPPNVTSTMFPTMKAGDDGRIAIAFHGTRDTAEYAGQAPAETRWHLYMVVSEDAGAADPTFTSYQATPDDDPVQVGPICFSGACRNLLDFIGSAAGPDGVFRVAFADGCTSNCAGKGDAKADDSRDDAVAVASLRGFSLRVPATPQPQS